MTDNDKSLVKYQEYGPVIIGTVHNTSMLDGLAVSEFGNQVVKFLNKRPQTNLMLNFQNVQYLSSAALTELIRINETAKEQGTKFHLCSISPDIQKVFEITQFDKLFEFHPGESFEDAAKKFRRSVELSQEDSAWKTKGKG